MAEDSVRDRLVKQLRLLKEEADDLMVSIQLADGDERADLQNQLNLIDEQIKQIETDLRVLQPKEIQIAYEKEWKELDEKLRKAKKDLNICICCYIVNMFHPVIMFFLFKWIKYYFSKLFKNFWFLCLVFLSQI